MAQLLTVDDLQTLTPQHASGQTQGEPDGGLRETVPSDPAGDVTGLSAASRQSRNDSAGAGTPAQLFKKPRRPYYKPSVREYNERVEFVGKCLSKLLTKTEIHRACEEKYGVDARTADRYLSRAKVLLHERCNMPKEEARELGLTVILDCLKSPKELIRLRAEERLAMIAGYESPRNYELTGKGGGPLELLQVKVDMDAVRKRIEAGVDQVARMDALVERGIVPLGITGGNGDGKGGAGGNGDGHP